MPLVLGWRGGDWGIRRAGKAGSAREMGQSTKLSTSQEHLTGRYHWRQRFETWQTS